MLLIHFNIINHNEDGGCARRQDYNIGLRIKIQY